MAYVRKRGNQLAIVHGARDPETRQVVQHTLFTLYSKAEALEALGRGRPDGDRQFRALIEDRHPHVRFDWAKLRRALEQQLHVLPDLYDYRAARLRAGFREQLTRFAKQLMLADPTELVSSARLIAEHRHELEYVRDLIDRCLRSCAQERTDWSGDNPFYWRFTMREREVPPDIEEEAADLYERGEHERAEAVFELLVDAFEDYAEGHNYLGLIALRQDKPAEAIARFERTVEVGRRLFPRRIPKSRWWSDLATRPYMRGLSNLALALVQAGRPVEALAACDRLEHECGDDLRAAAHRSAAYLALGEWRLAMEAARHGHRLSPLESLPAALAAFELGDPERARAWFLHAALNSPHAVAVVLGTRRPRPRTAREAECHDDGVMLRRSLRAYLDGPGARAVRHLRRLWKACAPLRAELEAVTRQRMAERTAGASTAFRRMTELQSLAFAERAAAGLAAR